MNRANIENLKDYLSATPMSFEASGLSPLDRYLELTYVYSKTFRNVISHKVNHQRARED